jgi:hypothetical protein
MAIPIGETATWVLTGEAAIIGTILANLQDVSQNMGSANLKWGISFLVLSMLAGAFAKQFGVAIQTALSGIDSIVSAMETEKGQEIQDNLAWKPEERANEIISAHLWPMNYFMRKAFSTASTDALFGEKRLIKMLCIEMYLSNIQSIFGVIGLLLLAFGIK